MKTISKTTTLIIVRVAGIFFLLSLIIPTLNWIFILSPFLSPKDNISMNILANEFLFRFNIINQIISSICIITLGYLLHLILKPIKEDVSLFALFFKTFESILTLILAFVYFIVLLMIKSGFNEETLITGLISNYISFTAIPGIFFGLGMLLFSLLFYKSDIIPKWLAILGVLSYILVILYDTSIILSLKYSSLVLAQTIGSAPVCIFQLIISMWFLFKKYDL